MTLNFVGASQVGGKLSEWKDRIVALGYLAATTVPTAEYGQSDAVRARFLAIGDTGAVDNGETLVFQKVLRDKLVAARGDMVVGKLIQRPHKSGKNGPDGSPLTYYDIEPLEGVVLGQAIDAFTKVASQQAS